jgi:predicted  nucleic acid-binding Zn-ribbon protein
MPARPFECLRCEHRYTVPNYDAKQVVERACPECGSNSVRPESKKKAKALGS